MQKLEKEYLRIIGARMSRTITANDKNQDLYQYITTMKADGKGSYATVLRRINKSSGMISEISVPLFMEMWRKGEVKVKD